MPGRGRRRRLPGAARGPVVPTGAAYGPRTEAQVGPVRIRLMMPPNSFGGGRYGASSGQPAGGSSGRPSGRRTRKRTPSGFSVGRPKARPLTAADGPTGTAWIWKPYVPRRHLTLLEGAVGTGKTWVALYVALSAARDGRAVLYVTDEHDDCELRARLERLGASKDDLKRIYYLYEPTLEALEAAARLRAYGLIVVDPITDLVPACLNPNLPAVLSPLRRLAKETGAAVLAVRHRSKAVPAGGPGSTVFAAKARSILRVGRLPEAATAYAMVHVKNNLGPRGPALEYRLDPDAERPLTWVGIRREDPAPRDVGLLERAVRWLRTVLADGPKPARAVLGRARDDGISERTLRRAKAVLGVVSVKGKGGWAWKLPDSPAVPPATPGAG